MISVTFRRSRAVFDSLMALFAAAGLSLCPCAAVGAAEAGPAPSIQDGVLWRFQTGKPIYAAPAADGDAVYFGGMDGTFYAVSVAAGRELWRYAARQPITSRAAVEGDTVCFECGDALIGVDRRSGAERWRYVARPDATVLSLDLTDYHHSSPVIARGVAYFGDSWGNLNGIDVRNGHRVFQYATPAGKAVRSTPAVDDGCAYFGDWAGHVYAVELATAKLRWSYTLENTRPYYGAVVSEFVIDRGVLYFGSQHDVFTPLSAATGRPVWRYVDPKATYLPSTPLVDKNRVIMGSTIFTLSVFCFDEHGNIVWRVPADGIFFVKPARRGSVLAINSSNFGGAGSLYFIDLATGRLIKRLAIGRASPSSPVFVGDHLLIGCGDGALYCLDYGALIKAP